MQLSLHAEYALRTLLYLGAHPDRVVSTKEISGAYGISKHHLVRVVQTLGDLGYVTVAPGRSGGVSLAIEPHRIRLGDVVRNAEPGFRLAECFDMKHNTCVVAPICTLKPVLRAALEAFLAALNRYTLADLMAGGAQRKLAAIFVSL